MPQERTIPLTFGDSLRAIADIADQVPSMIMSITHPDIPSILSVYVKSAAAVEGLATVLDASVKKYTAENGEEHTSFDIDRGRVTLRVFAIEEPVRVLRRTAVEPPAEGEWQLGADS